MEPLRGGEYKYDLTFHCGHYYTQTPLLYSNLREEDMKSLQGRHIAIFAEQLYEDLELWYPKLRLSEEGAEITVIGTGAETYPSKHGYPVKADASIEHVHVDGFDALVIPGGYAPDHMRRHAKMIEFVKKANDQDKVIAAICHGGWLLASAGIIHGRRVTGFFSIQDDLKNAGAVYVDAPVVRDGNLVTSRIPADLPFFCSAIIEAISERVRV